MKITRGLHTIIRFFSLFLIIFQFFGIEAIAQEIPSSAPEATVAETPASEVISTSDTSSENQQDTIIESTASTTDNSDNIESTEESSVKPLVSGSVDDQTIYEPEEQSISTGAAISGAIDLVNQYIPTVYTGNLSEQIDGILTEVNEYLLSGVDIKEYGKITVVIPKDVIISSIEDPIETLETEEPMLEKPLPATKQEKQQLQIITLYEPIESTSIVSGETQTLYEYNGEATEDEEIIDQIEETTNSQQVGTLSGESDEITSGVAENLDNISTDSESENTITDNTYNNTETVEPYYDYNAGFSRGDLEYKEAEYAAPQNNLVIESFEFGVQGEDLIFSSPIKIEIDLDETQLNYVNFGLQVKHASDDSYNTVGLSTDPQTLCDDQGNPTIPSTQLIPENGKLTFYTCRASDFLILAQEGYDSSCNIPIIWTNNTPHILIDTGTISSTFPGGTFTGSTNYEGANSTIGVSGNNIIYFTVNGTGGMGIVLSNSITPGEHWREDSAVGLFFAQDAENGQGIDATWDGGQERLIGTFYEGQTFFYMLSGNEASVHALDGSFSYYFPNSVSYPLYVDVLVANLYYDPLNNPLNPLPDTNITDAKIAAIGCLEISASCGNGVVDGTGGGSGDVIISKNTTTNINGDATSASPSISDDGRFVAFQTYAENLGFSGTANVVLYDKQLNTLISVASSTTDDFWDTHISADGKFITFWSADDYLVPGDSDITSDVFVYDVDNAALERITDGSYDAVSYPKLSKNGRYVTFTAIEGQTHIFQYDRQTATLTNITNGGNNASTYANMSENGRYITFQSTASNLVSGDTNARVDIFLYDTLTTDFNNITIAGNHNSNRPAISSDGRYITFNSTASNLVSGDTNGARDLFLYDTLTSQITLIPTTSTAEFYMNEISPDGRYLAFNDATNLIVYDRQNSSSKIIAPSIGQTTTIDFSYSADTITYMNIVTSGAEAPAQIFLTSIDVNEECDDGNGDNNDACSNSCTLNAPSCVGVNFATNSGANPSTATWNTKTGFTFTTLNRGTGTPVSYPTSPAVFNYPAFGTYTGSLTLVNSLSGSMTVSCTTGIVIDHTAVNGSCGVRHGSSFYDFSNGGDAITQTTLGLCTSGSVSGFGYNTGSHTWSWSCAGLSGGSSASCAMSELYCGDATNTGASIAIQDILISKNPVSNATGGGVSDAAKISKFGNSIVFHSTSSNLVTGDTATQDVFLYDKIANTMTRVSTGGNNVSRNASLSSDGRYTIYESIASNLVVPDSNGQYDIFIYDKLTNTNSKITSGNGGSFNARVSGDGKYIAIQSAATNLVAGDVNGQQDVFLYNANSGTIIKLTAGNNISASPIISENGRYISFYSQATNIVAGDTNGQIDAFVYDAQTASTVRVTNGNAASYPLAFSPDGKYVIVTSTASNLTSGDTNGVQDVFLYNRASGTVMNITASGNGASRGYSISADNKYVIGMTDATNLASGTDTNGVRDVFRYNTQTQKFTNITRTRTVASANGYITENGKQIVYNSNNQIFVYNDIEEQCDDGNGLDDDACSNSCELNAPTCTAFGFVVSPTTGAAPKLVTGTWTSISGYTVNTLNRGTGTPVSFPTSPSSFTFNYSGSYNPTITITNSYSGSLSISCSMGVSFTQGAVNGVCGTGHGYLGQVYTGTTPVGLCAAGTSANLSHDDYEWYWECVGQFGGTTEDYCYAPIGYCGDGIVGTGIGYSGQEQCDQGGSNGPNGACSTTCTLNTPSCANFNFAITPTTGTAPKLVTGTWTQPAGFAIITLNRGTGVPVVFPTSPATNTYTTPGSYTGTLTVANSLSGSLTASCNLSLNYSIPCAGVAGCELWLKANTGAYSDNGSTPALSGQSVQYWKNQANNNNATQATSGLRPLLQTNKINFNPVLSFDGSKNIDVGTDVNQNTAFVVGKRTAGTDAFWSTNAGSNRSFTRSSFGYQYDIFGTYKRNSSLTSDTLGTYGLHTATNPYVTNSLGTSGNNIGITRFGYAVPSFTYLVGDIAEVIIYSNGLNSGNTNIIESYLAIKYGITLDQSAGINYNISGPTLAWSTASAGSYNKDIAGIGRDDATTLSQSKSQSINNTGDIIVEKISGLTNGQTLLWANDAANRSSWTTSDIPVNLQYRIAREWKFQEKNGDLGTVKISIPLSGLPSTGTSDVVMLVDSDGTFAAGATIVTGSISGSNIVFEYNITDNQYITFAQAPYCGDGIINSAGIPTNGLLGYWSFNNSNATDDSGLGNTGMLFNGVQFTGGKKGTGALFNDSNSYIGIYPTDDLDLDGQNDMTFSIWAKLATGDQGYLVSKPWDGGGHYNYTIHTNNGLITFGINNGISPSSEYITGMISAGIWQHIVGVVTNDTMKLYINGNLASSSGHSFTSRLAGNGDYILVGSLYPYGSGWGGNAGFTIDGVLDDFRIYNRSLTNSDIQNLYTFGEECDDGNGVDGDACSNTCNYNTPSCPAFNFTVTPSTGYTTLPVTGTWNTVGGFTVTSLDRGTGTPIGTPISPASYTYANPSTYNASLTIVNASSGAFTNTCNVPITIAQGSPDLTIAKSLYSALPSYASGDNIAFSMTVSNSGTSVATGFTISDDYLLKYFQGGFQINASGATVSNFPLLSECGTPSISYALFSNTFSINITGASLTPSSSCTYIVTGQLQYVNYLFNGACLNTAVVTNSYPSENAFTGNNTGTVTGINCQGPIPGTLTIDKSSDQTGYIVGDIITYTIYVANNSSGSTFELEIKDIAPPGITFANPISYTLGGNITPSFTNTGTATGFTLNDEDLVMQTGKYLSITFTGMITGTGYLCNTGTAHWYLSAPTYPGGIKSAGPGSGSVDVACVTVLDAPIDGVCGPLDGSGALYDFNNSGDLLTGSSTGLCDTGLATGFSFNTSTHEWTWSCLGQFSGTDASCSAQELYCGDGVVNSTGDSSNLTMLSKNPNSGASGNSYSLYADISSNGRYAVFQSTASNLVSGDTNGSQDIFLYDKVANVMKDITISGNQHAYDASISADGRYVSFRSSASNLVPGDTNGNPDIFRYDAQTDTLENITIMANDGSNSPKMSSDGRYLSFISSATNLVSGDSNSNPDVFRYDFQTDTFENITLSHLILDGEGEPADISDNGRYITFYDYNISAFNIMLYDRQLDTMSNITNGSADSYTPHISDDGRYIVFPSDAPNLVSGDVNGYTDVFLYDLNTTSIENLTLSGDGYSAPRSISADGRYIMIDSEATNLVTGDVDGYNDILKYDRQNNSFTNITRNENNAYSPTISSNGRYIAYNIDNQLYLYSEGIEQCDDGNGIDDDACNNSCGFNVPSCDDISFVVAPTTGVAPRLVTGTWNSLTGFTASTLYRGTGVPVAFPTSPASYTYTASGIYTAALTVSNNLSGIYFNICNIDLSIDPTPIDGVCGPLDGSGTLYDFNNSGDLLTDGSTGLCNVGVATGFTFDTGTHIWSWSCLGQFSGSDASCSAQELYCGDGTINSTGEAEENFMVSKNPFNNATGNSSSPNAVISDNNQYIVFTSPSSNLVTGDTNGKSDIFVYNRQTNTLENITFGFNGNANFPAISADGRYVAYSSDMDNWATPGVDSNGVSDVFVYDRQTDTLEVIDLATDGAYSLVISADGRYVTFLKAGSIFVYDRQTSTLENITVESGYGDAEGEPTDISADGRYVAYYSYTTGAFSIILYDRQTNTLQTIGGENGYDAYFPSLSDDGRYITFVTEDPNLVSGDTTDRDGFLYDVQGDTFTNLTMDVANVVYGVNISANGRYIVISVDGGYIYVYDRVNNTKKLIIDNGSYAYIGNSVNSISNDGSIVYKIGDGQIYLYGNVIEECDDGNGIDDDACSNSCSFNIPSCPAINFVVSPTTGFVPKLVTGTRNTVGGFTVTTLNRGTGTPVSSPTSPATYTYTVSGAYTAILSIENNLSGAYSATCSIPISLLNSPINGLCGPIHNSGTLYDFNNSGDSLTGSSTGLCDTGLATGFTYNTGTHIWSWSCLGQFSGSDASCSSQELYCGDGAVNSTGEVDENFIVSKNPITNEAGNNTSSIAYVSAGGRFTSFHSNASNLVTGDVNGVADVFVYDKENNTLENITLSGNAASSQSSISSDGRYVAFRSNATNLVGGDTNGIGDVFVYDRQTQVMKNITITGNAGTQQRVTMTADGRYITFESPSNNLVAGDAGNLDVFVYDNSTDILTNITLGANGNSDSVRISDNGRYIVFESAATNLGPPDIGGPRDIFVYDMQDHSFENITDGHNTNIQFSDISDDGRYVVFESNSTNLVAGDTNGKWDIFLYDRQTNVMKGVTISGNNDSNNPTISANGRYVEFYSLSTNLVSGDINGVNDVFIYDRILDIITSPSSKTNVSGVSSPAYSSMSADGRFLPMTFGGQAYIYNSTIEQCDDGNGVDDDACSNSCSFNTPSCPAINFVVSPTTGFVPKLITGTRNTIGGFTVTSLDRGTGTPVSSPTSPAAYTYTISGAYTAILSVENSLSGAYAASCVVPIYLLNAPVNGACGTMNSGTIYDFNNSGDMLTGASSGLCLSGTLTGFTFDTGTHIWSWSCLGQFSGSDTSCNTQELYCGDGTVNSTGTMAIDMLMGHGGLYGIKKISANGQYILFETNIVYVTGDTNSKYDLYLYNIKEHSYKNITMNTGMELSYPSLIYNLSADGRYIIFSSIYSGFAGDTNANTDIFIYDTITDAYSSVTSGNSSSSRSAISADGRYTSFMSYATNLVPGDLNNNRDIFMYDTQTSSMINVTSGGNHTFIFGAFIAPSISANGRYTVFYSNATNLVPGYTDLNGNTLDVFLYDAQTNSRKIISSGGNNESRLNSLTSQSISADGRYIVYESTASNLVSGFTDPNGSIQDIFIYDNTTNLVKNITSGGNNASLKSSISADGRYVVYESTASNLVSGDSVNRDVFLYNIQNGITQKITNDLSVPYYDPSISTDGRYVVFSDNTQTYLYYSIIEQCDDGNTDNDDACSNSCSFNTPSCTEVNLVLTPDEGLIGVTVTGTWTTPSWATATTLDRGTGTPVTSPTSPSAYTYYTQSIYDVSLTLVNNLSTGYTAICTAVVDVWGDVCINAATGISFTGLTVGGNTGVYTKQTEYFDVDDQKGFDSGYYTTLEMTNLTGSNGGVLSKSYVRWKGTGTLDLLSGVANVGVVLDSAMNTYQIADHSTLFIKRNPAANMRKKSRYGNKLNIEVSIPPYFAVDTYHGVITYTLFEN